MIINKDYEIEYSNEFNQAMCQFAISAGDEIKGLTPMERFYAIKLLSERLENLISIYVMVGSLNEELSIEPDETFES